MKRIWGIVRYVLIIVLTVVLSTVAINATDNMGYISNSLLGAVLSVETNDGCPKNMVFVPHRSGGFCIDMYEVSAHSECMYDTPKNQNETQRNLEQQECKPESKANAQPWTFIARHQAEQACAKSGKRLPTSSEWYQAALGTPDVVADSYVCNLSSKNQSSIPTGSFSRCISSTGVYDMVGNVWEWVTETAQDGYIKNIKLPSEGYVSAVNQDGLTLETTSTTNAHFYDDYFWVESEGNRGVLRGGFYQSGSDGGLYSSNITVPISFAGVGVGFRCVL